MPLKRLDISQSTLLLSTVTFMSVTPSVNSRSRFENMCQANLVSDYHTIFKAFDFRLDSEWTKTGQCGVVATYKRWMDRAKSNDIPAIGGVFQGTPV